MFNLQNFNYNNLPISVLIDNTSCELLFDASHVCDVLGYEKETCAVIEKLDEDEKVLLDREKFPDPTESVGSGCAWHVQKL